MEGSRDCSGTLKTYRDKKERKERGTRKGAREQALAPKQWSHTTGTGCQLGRPARRDPCIQLSEEEAGADFRKWKSLWVGERAAVRVRGKTSKY